MNKTGSRIENLHGQRKEDHIKISLSRDVEFKDITTGFENYRFLHQALPDIDLQSVDLSTDFLGKRLNAPILISSMVGGVESAEEINHNLAAAARELGLAMGVGSQRCAIDCPESSQSFNVRPAAPDIFLCANIGAVQLNYSYGVDECRRAVEMIEADALVLHLNPLQEALQDNGNTDFSGLLHRIETVCSSIDVPVIVKEVSFGICGNTARKLNSAGVSAIDVAGAGGTSWSEVEKFRSSSEIDFNIASAFASWGIPTAESIMMIKEQVPGIPVIASGGIRDGLDAAKAIALGADLAGTALPLLKAACQSPEAVTAVLMEIIEVMRIAMFCIGASTVSELRGTELLMKRSRG